MFTIMLIIIALGFFTAFACLGLLIRDYQIAKTQDAEDKRARAARELDEAWEDIHPLFNV